MYALPAFLGLNKTELKHTISGVLYTCEIPPHINISSRLLRIYEKLQKTIIN